MQVLVSLRPVREERIVVEDAYRGTGQDLVAAVEFPRGEEPIAPAGYVDNLPRGVGVVVDVGVDVGLGECWKSEDARGNTRGSEEGDAAVRCKVGVRVDAEFFVGVFVAQTLWFACPGMEPVWWLLFRRVFLSDDLVFLGRF